MYDFISGLKALRAGLFSTTWSFSVLLDCLERKFTPFRAKQSTLVSKWWGLSIYRAQIQQMVATLPFDFVVL
jgi:hypothetical protein